MARPIDPDQHRRRRAEIVGAASTLFARAGYDRTSTAAICRAAGISSGTFFHYFPTKLDVLLAVLAVGRDLLIAELARIEAGPTGLPAVLALADLATDELVAAEYATFAGGLAGVEDDPRVASALQAEADAMHDVLIRQLRIGVEDTAVREDVPLDELARWVAWLIDGASQQALSPRDTPPSLREAVEALIGRAPRPAVSPPR